MATRASGLRHTHTHASRARSPVSRYGKSRVEELEFIAYVTRKAIAPAMHTDTHCITPCRGHSGVSRRTGVLLDHTYTGKAVRAPYSTHAHAHIRTHAHAHAHTHAHAHAHTRTRSHTRTLIRTHTYAHTHTHTHTHAHTHTHTHRPSASWRNWLNPRSPPPTHHHHHN